MRVGFPGGLLDLPRGAMRCGTRIALKVNFAAVSWWARNTRTACSTSGGARCEAARMYLGRLLRVFAVHIITGRGKVYFHNWGKFGDDFLNHKNKVGIFGGWPASITPARKT